ncbi:hypothetical protein OCK74_19405 [Chitinophagaceae bacterium LB-8]|uniref:Nucleotide-diphospho-sugar transferase n=1 Tax=Paraflavisolibacter caeni TaxID=2982496 RepID=A0A9X2Y161_9BACT|nr:hypothetical protein [Paraflavisolibacter caeni]MCU7551298.1 hypothetical protein [Paraflavisolibacter caeni]
MFIAADGPRKNHPEDIEKCANVRKLVLEQINWDCEVKTLFRDENLGCGIGPSDAITWFFEHVEYGIILEDDCLPSQSFFTFCEELLKKYFRDEKVMHISGNNFQFGKKQGDGSYYFSNYINAWGWATWRRAWSLYDFNIKNYTDQTANAVLDRVLSSKVEKKFWKGHFDTVKDGKRKDIWDYQWVYTVWNHNGISIIPNVNLVSNIGFGSDATHTFDSKNIVANHPSFEINKIVHPGKMIISKSADKRLFRICHQPKLTLRDRAYLVKKEILKLIKI